MVKGLGRGLSSLIPPHENKFSTSHSIAASMPELKNASSVRIVEIQLNEIDPNPLQPRQHFAPDKIEELAASIAEHGLLEPIVVTPVAGRYQIVAGERRFRALKKMNKSTIPAIVREASELERLELGLIENIQREDLNPMERAYGIAKLVNDFGLTQEQAAKKLGKARSSVANTLRLLTLPVEIQKGLSEEKITEGHAKLLLTLPSDQQMIYYKQISSGPSVSVQELASRLKRAVTKSKNKFRNFEYKEIEDQLQTALGTKVNVLPKKEGGKILIETFSKEEFRSVIKKLVATD